MLRRLARACALAALLPACAHTGKPVPLSPYETARAAQGEVRSSLATLALAERAYFQEKDDRYSNKLQDIGFAPEPGNRYSYYLAVTGALAPRVANERAPADAVIVPVDRTAFPSERVLPTSDETQCPITGAPGQSGRVEVKDDRFLVLAAGNLDADPAFDCWTIASFDRVTSDGRAIARFTPHLEQEDVVGTPEDIARFERNEKIRVGATKVADAVCSTVGHGREVPASFAETLADTEKDPWGRPFAAAYAGERDGGPEFLVVSAGPDGKLATSDDAAFKTSCDKLRPAMDRPYGANENGLVVTLAPVPAPPNGAPAGGVSTAARAAAGEWVALPSGTFTVGPHESEWNVREPRRPVQVAPFALGKTEVSVAQFRRCVEAGACKAPPTGSAAPPSDDELDQPSRIRRFLFCNWYLDAESQPMNCVTWMQANDFCTWVGGRLPTKYEWEYAAKGGGNRRYPWGDESITPRRARYPVSGGTRGASEEDEDRSEEALARRFREPKTAPVTAHEEGASTHGVLNLVGNVAEWTATASTSSPGSKETRGGGWNDWEHTISITFGEDARTDTDDDAGLGFRCAQTR